MSQTDNEKIIRRKEILSNIVENEIYDYYDNTLYKQDADKQLTDTIYHEMVSLIYDLEEEMAKEEYYVNYDNAMKDIKCFLNENNNIPSEEKIDALRNEIEEIKAYYNVLDEEPTESQGEEEPTESQDEEEPTESQDEEITENNIDKTDKKIIDLINEIKELNPEGAFIFNEDTLYNVPTLLSSLESVNLPEGFYVDSHGNITNKNNTESGNYIELCCVYSPINENIEKNKKNKTKKKKNVKSERRSLKEWFNDLRSKFKKNKTTQSSNNNSNTSTNTSNNVVDIEPTIFDDEEVVDFIYENYTIDEIKKKINKYQEKLVDKKLQLQFASDEEKDKINKKIKKNQLLVDSYKLKLKLYEEGCYKAYIKEEEKEKIDVVKDSIKIKEREDKEYIEFWENVSDENLGGMQQFSDKEIIDLSNLAETHSVVKKLLEEKEYLKETPNAKKYLLTKTKAQLVDIAKAHGILLYETNKNDMVEKLKDVKDIQRMIYQDSEYKLTK